MSVELIHALDQLEREKGIDKEVLIEAIEAALISAYKRNFGSTENVSVYIDRLTGDVKVFVLKKVSGNSADQPSDVAIDESETSDENIEQDDMVEIEITPREFGRIAAQTAKQVVVQRIREAERGIIFEEFHNKEGDIVTGIVQRMEKRNVIIDLGKTEAILTFSEQAPVEAYRFNDRIKTYIIEVKKASKGPQIYVSRTHPGLVKRLFELEVPEIYEGVVEIKTISREAGSRTKLAVFSRDDNVDPVGACVGQKGSRVQAIVDELRGEKIDIIRWSSDAEEFISSSLSPAKVIRVDIDKENKSAEVIVPDFQLSLAIGKEGQNARLAAKLTGWKIDIKNESQLRARIEQQLLNYNENYQEEQDEEEEIADDIDDVEESMDTENSIIEDEENEDETVEEVEVDSEQDAIEDKEDIIEEDITEDEEEEFK